MKKVIPWLVAGLTFSLSGGASAALFDRGGGLIYDSTLNVTWLQDANYSKTSGYDDVGDLDWQPAQDWAANLSYYDSVRGVTWDDWRLPKVEPVNGANFNYNFANDGSTDWGYNITSPHNEIAYMYYVNLGNEAFVPTEGVYSSCLISSSNCLENVGPFVNLEAGIYWAGAINELGPYNAMYFGMNSGGQAPTNEGTIAFYTWAVRDGDVAAVPEASTYAMMLVGLGLVGFMARRMKQELDLSKAVE